MTALRLIFYLGLLAAVGSRPVNAAPDLRPPENLSAWFSGSYVQVVWDRDFTQELAGYAVYRSARPTGVWEKLTSEPFPFVTFVDFQPPVGTVRYWVKAVGLDGRESAEGYVVEAAVTPPEVSRKPAAPFNRHNIITDAQLLDLSAMSSVETIQHFLDAHGSVLATHQTVDRYNGNAVKSAARMIFDACRTWSINPQVILTTLQKEKGLIKSNTANPENLAMGWNETVDSTKDFAAQVYKGTRQFSLYLDRLTNQPGYYTDKNGKPWAVGETMALLDGTVTPASKATAGLYIYTPWIGQGGGGQSGIGGNYLFWDLWYNSFQFGPGVTIPDKPKTLSPGKFEPDVETISTTTPTLMWEAIEGALYDVFVSKGPWGEGIPITIVFQQQYLTETSVTIPEGRLEDGATYRWNMIAYGNGFQTGYSDRRYLRVALPTEAAHPEGYSLEQNFPNPFNGVTNIRFTIPAPSDVKITIYSASGQHVATLVNGYFTAGTHQISWRADSAGSGLYYYRLEAGPFVRTKRLVLMR